MKRSQIFFLALLAFLPFFTAHANPSRCLPDFVEVPFDKNWIPEEYIKGISSIFEKQMVCRLNPDLAKKQVCPTGWRFIAGSYDGFSCEPNKSTLSSTFSCNAPYKPNERHVKIHDHSYVSYHCDLPSAIKPNNPCPTGWRLHSYEIGVESSKAYFTGETIFICLKSLIPHFKKDKQ